MRTLKTMLCFVLVWASCPVAMAAVVVTALATPLNLHDDFLGSYEPIDVDANGTTDFTFGYNFQSVGLRTEGANRAIILLAGGHIIGGNLTSLEPGYSIAPTLLPGASGTLEWASSDYLGGYVSPGENAFLNIVLVLDAGSASGFSGRGSFGILFEADDGWHYGYVDIDAGPGYAGVTLYGWAYESQPNTAITAGSVPEPSQTVLLLFGILSVLCHRRRALGQG